MAYYVIVALDLNDPGNAQCANFGGSIWLQQAHSADDNGRYPNPDPDPDPDPKPTTFTHCHSLPLTSVPVYRAAA